MYPKASELFDFYRKTASAAIPRDPKFLEGMYAIRRVPNQPYASYGNILKTCGTRQQFQYRDFTNQLKPCWVAFVALIDDVILLHGDREMFAIYSCLAKTWQAEVRAENEAKKAGGENHVQ